MIAARHECCCIKVIALFWITKLFGIFKLEKHLEYFWTLTVIPWSCMFCFSCLLIECCKIDYSQTDDMIGFWLLQRKRCSGLCWQCAVFNCLCWKVINIFPKCYTRCYTNQNKWSPQQACHSPTAHCSALATARLFSIK